jgi:phosphoglycolate phosphatase-like HAD superfamily hydrolase
VPHFETTAPFAPRPQISHVVFDFDGTLSWLRHGWPELMAGLFLRHLPEAQHKVAPEEEFSSIHDLLLNDILSLNGKSSIFQMERCAERVVAHGGPKLDPQQMLSEYQAALQAAVRERSTQINDGHSRPEDFVVHGARSLLELLRARNLVLIILSGTLEPQVKAEAELLGIASFFGRHIYGGTADLQKSSKKAVIERLLNEEGIAGEHLLSFGDGPVEIRLTKAAGGLAVGIASDEDRNGSGLMDPHKRRQLREAGADLLIADYRNPALLLESLLGR